MCEYMGDTRGSGFVSTADDVLEMSVVRGVRGVGGVCEMCVFGSWRVRRCEDEWVRGLGLGFINPVGIGGSNLLRDPAQFILGPQGTQYPWCTTKRHCAVLYQ